MTNAVPPDFSALLRLIERDFPADFLTQEPEDLSEYGRDWTRVYTPAPSAIALPQAYARLIGGSPLEEA